MIRKKLPGIAALCLSIFILWKAPAYAAPAFTVTPVEATFFTTEGAQIFQTPDAGTAPVAVVGAGIPVQVTGVTSNLFFVVDIGGTFYMPALALTVSTDAAPAVTQAPSYSALIAIPERNAAANNANDAIIIADQAISDRVENLNIAVPANLCESVYQSVYEYLSTLSNVKVAAYNLADIRSMELGYNTGGGGKVYVNFVYGSAGHDAEVESVIQSKYTEFAALPTAYDKVRAVHDYLCKRIVYTPDDFYSHTAYGALISGNAVCDGYALSFQRFMDVLGIPCYIATGVRNNEPHAWNLVQLDGQWYHIDVTWDDQTWGIIRDYFLISGKNAGYSDWGGITLAGRNY